MCGPLDLDACHEHFSVFAFNETWRLLEQKTLSEEEEEKMLQLAMTSYFHFSQNTKVSSENLSVSAWLISRVFSTLGDAQQALRWAKRADFNLKKGTNSALYYKAYVHEAFGRAYSVGKEWSLAANHVSHARNLAEQVKKATLRAPIMDDLKTIKLYSP